MADLVDNEPVTVLVDGLLVHARVAGHAGERWGTMRKAIPGWQAVRSISLAEEGSVWCRGHVTERDPAGAALLVAGALAPNRARGPDWSLIEDAIGTRTRHLPTL